jgi:Cu2+-containing amine oxidase
MERQIRKEQNQKSSRKFYIKKYQKPAENATAEEIKIYDDLVKQRRSYQNNRYKENEGIREKAKQRVKEWREKKKLLAQAEVLGTEISGASTDLSPDSATPLIISNLV